MCFLDQAWAGSVPEAPLLILQDEQQALMIASQHLPSYKCVTRPATSTRIFTRAHMRNDINLRELRRDQSHIEGQKRLSCPYKNLNSSNGCRLVAWSSAVVRQMRHKF